MKTYFHILAVAMLAWVLAVGTAWAHGAAHGAGGGGDHPHMWSLGSLFMNPLFAILIIPVIAVAIVVVFRAIGRSAATGGTDSTTALDE